MKGVLPQRAFTSASSSSVSVCQSLFSQQFELLTPKRPWGNMGQFEITEEQGVLPH